MQRRVIIYTLLITLLITLVSVSTPRIVQAACTSLSGGLPNNSVPPVVPVNAGDPVHLTYFTGPFAITVDGTLSGVPFSVTGTGSATFNGVATTNGTFVVTSAVPLRQTLNLRWVLTVGNCSGAGGNVCPLFHDGRLNDCDPAETAAVYCDSGDVVVYAVADSKGYFAFRVPRRAIQNAQDELEHMALPKHHLLLGQGLWARLYLLTTGQLQVNGNVPDPAKDDYVFIFPVCPAHN